MILFLDTETYSATPIKQGAYKYAADAEVMIATYAIDDGPVHDIDFTIGIPEDVWMFQNLLANATTIVAHNAMFDRNVIRLGNLKIETPIEKWRCSMVKALLHGLPGGLDKLCEILKVPQELAKQKDGRRLVLQFCKPLGANRKLRRATRETHKQDWEHFIEYARHDIHAMREVWKKLPSWNYSDTGIGAVERDLWHLDQKINDRGVFTDQALVAAAIRATDAEQLRLKDCVREHTDGYVEAATQRDRMLEFIFAEYGMGMADMTKASVTKMLDRDDIDHLLRQLLELRQQASKTSTAKYAAFQRAANDDHRVRGMLQFSGAARTRRDAGRTVQLQNLASRGLLPQDQIEVGVEALLAGAEDLLFDDIMLLTASTIRSVIQAPPGKKLVVSDLSNIEGRGLAWLAGEEWKLQAFRDFDAGIGADLYKLAYAKAFNIEPGDVTKFGRSIGKVMELGLGYAGGISAFVTFALVYGIDLDEMADIAWDNIPGNVLHDAQSFVEWLKEKGQHWPMSDKAAVVCESFKRMWREAHPMTVRLWFELENGFRLAVETPGKTFSYRGFKFRRDGAWLRIMLPSGRFLCYPHPVVDKDGCSFMGVNQFTRKWERVRTYSGKLAENACQSVARDVMFDAMPGIEAAGYEIILRVHDEVPCEAPDLPEYNAGHLSSLLAKVPPWAEGFPLAAAGFESNRYKKD